MPTRSLERWNNDGSNLEARLQELGYETSLQYADNEVDQQINQIQTMLNQDPEVLVIAPIDGTALTPVLEAAETQGVTVIAYDRLINDSEAVDYYATFDNYQVGQMQGEFIVSELGLEDGEEGPFTLEPFAGSPDDNNARFFFAGAWDVLLPYIEGGQLVVPSGKAPARRRGSPPRRTPGLRLRLDPRQRGPRDRHHPPGARPQPLPVRRGEHLPRQRAGQGRGHRLERHEQRGGRAHGAGRSRSEPR